MKKHFSSAEGSPIQRSIIAVSMAAIEDEVVQLERKKLPQEQQVVFMMTYECFVMWSLKRGFEPILDPQDTESAVVGMRDNFAKHAWYESGSFEKIWTSVQQLMPSSLTPKGQLGMIYPVVDLITAANLAGFSLEIPTDYIFGVHVIQTIASLADVGRQLGEEHLTFTQKK